MRVGTTLNSKGWVMMISEGLRMLETATAGVNVPQLWVLFESFFGKIDDNISVTSTPSATGHPTTFCAAKCKMAEGGIEASNYKQVVPGPNDDEPGTNLILYYSGLVIC